MTRVIGTDEAGYGPNLGPLVVAATVWKVSGDAEAALATITPAAGTARSEPLWADSKTVYRGGDGFGALERGVHAALSLCGADVTDWASLAAVVGAIGPERGAADDWARLDALTLPRTTAREACREAAAMADALLVPAGIAIDRIACRAVYPSEFNRLLDAGLNKSDILSRTTLDLVATLLDPSDAGETIVWCDRHGGRKRYAALVARHFAAALVQPVEETAACSAYVVPAARLRIEFTVGGEARLPVALASMTAKYVRELAMTAFNDFWQARLPGLAPTAGYPVDARRWRAATAGVVQAAGIPADHLWRRA